MVEQPVQVNRWNIVLIHFKTLEPTLKEFREYFSEEYKSDGVETNVITRMFADCSSIQNTLLIGSSYVYEN